MKAWKVYDTDYSDGGCVVVFADTATKARAVAMRRMEHGPSYVDIRAERFPKMDGREANPPTCEELVRECGWWTLCSWCEGVIRSGHEDEEYDHGIGFFEGDIATCGVCAAHSTRAKAGGG